MLEPKTNELLGRLVTLLTHHVIPICEDDDQGRPYVTGSSLLITIDDEYFLVTAAHVLDPLKENRKLFFYFDKKTKCNLDICAVFTTIVPNDIRQADKLDVGVA